MNGHRKIILDNGLRVILVPKETYSVNVLLLFGAGTDYEKRDQKGIYHFLEHLPFKGTIRRPISQEGAKVIEAVGGDINAFTEEEILGFFTQTSPENLELCLDVLSDLISDPLFREGDIRREAEVVVEEVNLNKDVPEDYLQIFLWNKLLYGEGQPAGWSILGTKTSIRNFKREKIIQIFENHFHAQNLVLVIAGKFDDAKTRELTNKYFGAIRGGNIQPKPKVVERQIAPRILAVNKATEQTRLALGFRLPGHNLASPARHALSILSTILGGNQSSRLFLSVRDKEGLAYDISTDFSLWTDKGYFLTTTGVSHDKVVKAIKIILAVHRKIKDEGVLPDELEAAKAYQVGSFYRNMDNLTSLSFFYGQQELLLSRISTPEDEKSLFLATTKEQVDAVAAHIFRPENLNLVYIGPNAKSKEKELSKILKRGL